MLGKYYDTITLKVGERMYNYYPVQYPQQGYQQQQFRQPMPTAIKGRIVSCLDEVKAAQIDFDGTVNYFPCPADGAIYAKCIDLNGLPQVQKYVIAQATPSPKYVTEEMLEQRLASIKEMHHEQSNAINPNPANV